MDSVSQLALGAAIGVAVMGRRTAVWKAALWGGLAGTLPDLDVLFDHGDPVRNMTLHRGASHAPFWQTLASPFIAALPALLHGERALFRRWWLAIWLALVTHALLDAMTVYGTQLLLPFSSHPFGVGSIFIIDPLYTLPLLVGLAGALLHRPWRGLRWNQAGLLVSTAYLAWSVAAQWHVREVAREALAARGVEAAPLLVTPTPFNTIVWRVVALRGDGTYEEGFHSLLDEGRSIRFDRFDRFAPDRQRIQPLLQIDAVHRIAAFSHGFYRLHVRGGQAWVTDLRMGQEPNYVFSFRVARLEDGQWVPTAPVQQGFRGDIKRSLEWLGQRLLGRDIPPPR